MLPPHMQTDTGPPAKKPAWAALTPMDKMHLAMCFAHCLGGIVTIALALPCDVAQANQRAMLPAAIPVALKAHNISEVSAYLAAFPWSEDAYLSAYVWNPYILVAAFEWLTAAFALCNLWHLTHHIKMVTLIWMAAGAALIVMWLALNSRRASDPCIAMAATLAVSYAAATWLCLSSLAERGAGGYGESCAEKSKLLNPQDSGEFQDDQSERKDTSPEEDSQGQEQPLTIRSRMVVEQGRTW